MFITWVHQTKAYTYRNIVNWISSVWEWMITRRIVILCFCFIHYFKIIKILCFHIKKYILCSLWASDVIEKILYRPWRLLSSISSSLFSFLSSQSFYIYLLLYWFFFNHGLYFISLGHSHLPIICDTFPVVRLCL